MKTSDIISLIINQLKQLLSINIKGYDILVKDEPNDNSDIAAIYSHEHDIIFISPYALKYFAKEPQSSALVKLYGLLAHEMRHAWQLKTYGAVYFNNYTRGDNSHISEIDAYGFQEAVMQILTGTGKNYIINIDDKVHQIAKKLRRKFEKKLIKIIQGQLC